MKIKSIIKNADITLLYDLIRIYIGIGLLLKGIQFITMPTALSILMEGSQLKLFPC